MLLGTFMNMVQRELDYYTYSRYDMCDRTIDTELLRQLCPLDQSSSKTPLASKIRAATASLGRLDVLPLETLQNTLSYLDLSSLTCLRSISRRLRALVDSLHHYRAVVTHAPNALRALLSTHAAPFFTASDLYQALRAQDCFWCGDNFGTHLYLLECRRCCWKCLTSARDLLPIAKEPAKLFQRLDARTMAEMPTLLSLPGFYGLKEVSMPHMYIKHGKRITLVSYRAVRKAGPKLHGREAKNRDYEKAKLETRIALRGPLNQDFMRDTNCANYDRAGYNAGYGLEAQRFMAAVRFPTLSAGTVEWGISCLGCLEHARDGDEERYWNEQYTKEGMVEHLKHCDKKQQSWLDDRVRELHKR